jgi:hypothetical protein
MWWRFMARIRAEQRRPQFVQHVLDPSQFVAHLGDEPVLP